MCVCSAWKRKRDEAEDYFDNNDDDGCCYCCDYGNIVEEHGI